MSFSHKLAASVLVVSVFYAAAACSSGSAGSPGGSAAGDRNSFIRQVCDAYMPCCTKAGKSADPSKCVGFYTAFTSGAQYDAAAANKCLDELRAQSGSPTYCDNMSGSTPSCQRVFGGAAGTAKPGETCNEDDDCAPSTEGEVECARASSGGATIKKCQVQITGKLGDTPCVGTRDGNVTSYSGSMTDVAPKGYICYVKDGLRCDSTTKACKAIPKLGEACESFGSNSCTTDAYCDSTTKLCVARKAVGQACDTFRDDCVETAYCHDTTKVCTAAIADGGACKTSQECASRNCTNGKCEANGSVDFLCGG